MTTEKIRKVIKVTDWNLTEAGLTISYEREDSQPKALHLILNPIETLGELHAVGSVYSINEHSNMGLLSTGWFHFKNIVHQYKMCQWEALSIAIRHEEEKELANDMNMLELDAAINALK